MPGIYASTLVLLIIFCGLGSGNGSVFQLVPLRFPFATAVASSLIGEVGALGGAFIPNAMGLSKQYLGNFSAGFLSFAALTIIAFVILRMRQSRWIGDWVGVDGRALPRMDGRVVMFPVIPAMEIY